MCKQCQCNDLFVLCSFYTGIILVIVDAVSTEEVGTGSR